LAEERLLLNHWRLSDRPHWGKAIDSPGRVEPEQPWLAPGKTQRYAHLVRMAKHAAFNDIADRLAE
jgi:uncharacterized protein affecting Mg2+/Co2+ transport